MRYLKDTKTNSVELVDDNDDERFYALLAERQDDGTPKYVQTGAHDPAVTQVTVPGQSPATLADQVSGIDPSIATANPIGTSPDTGATDGEPVAEAAADGDDESLKKAKTEISKSKAELTKREKAAAARAKELDARQAELEKREQALAAGAPSEADKA